MCGKTRHDLSIPCPHPRQSNSPSFRSESAAAALRVLVCLRTFACGLTQHHRAVASAAAAAASKPAQPGRGGSRDRRDGEVGT